MREKPNNLAIKRAGGKFMFLVSSEAEK